MRGKDGIARDNPVSPCLRVPVSSSSSFILPFPPYSLYPTPYTQVILRTTTVTLLNDLLNKLISFTYQTKTGYQGGVCLPMQAKKCATDDWLRNHNGMPIAVTNPALHRFAVTQAG